jgi:hypothetical protein
MGVGCGCMGRRDGSAGLLVILLLFLLEREKEVKQNVGGSEKGREERVEKR